MLLCTDPEFIVLLSLVAMLLVSYLLVRWRLPGKPMAFVEVKPDSEWRLGFAAPPGRKYKLLVRFDVAFQGGRTSTGWWWTTLVPPVERWSPGSGPAQATSFHRRGTGSSEASR